MVKRKLLSIVFLLCMSLSLFAQANKPISVSFNAERATTALHKVEKLAGLSIQYNYSDVDYRITLNAHSMKAIDVVRAIIHGHALRVEEKDNALVILKVANTPQDKEIGMGRKLQGMVTDSKGDPITGAIIRDRDGKVSTVSDIDGKFSLDAKDTHIVLNVSYLGMKPAHWQGRNTDYAVIVMEDNSQTLQDVVVTGYQQIDRRNLTSSVTSVKMSEINRDGVSTIDKMLQGRIPDLVLTNGSGEVNSVPRLRIRGTSTLIGNREPLWVVDGIIVNDPVNLSADVINDPDYINRIGNAISGINPQDIDRIDVLKDASATALYGTRAANGVIVITTKKGRPGKPVVSYTATTTLRRRPRYTDGKIDLMNSLERTQVSRELAEMHYSYPANMSYVGYEDAMRKYYAGVYTREEFENAVAQAETQNTDWFKLLTRDSFSMDHSANISGGSDKFRYYASLGYTGDNDVIRDNYNRRYTASTNLDMTLSNKIKVGFQLSMYTDKKRYDQSDVNPINYAYNTSRVIPAYNSDGTYYYYKKTSGGNSAYSYNILNELDNSYMKQSESGLKATVNVRYTPEDWLFFDAIASYSSSNTNIEGWYGEKSWYAAALRQTEYGIPAGKTSVLPFGGELSENDIRNNNWTVRLQGNMNKYFGKYAEHNINLAIGVEANSTHYQGNAYTQRGYYADRGKKFITSVPDNYTSFINWMTTNFPTITDNLLNLLSAYGTLSYSYKQYFTLNANTRYDGSNRFGDRSNEKILPVWSVSGLANILEISGWKPKWMDALTWKISYGGQGNMLEGQTPKLTLTKGAYDTHYQEMISTVNKFANPDLKWEKTYSFNTGLEAALFHSRLLLSAEVYYKKTNDAFMDKTISDVNGFTSYVVNSGQIINKGYNLSVTATPIQTKNWNWMVSCSLSKVINKMNTEPGEDAYQIQDYLDGTAIINGKAIGSFYSYRFIGLNPADGGPLFDDWQDRASELVGLNNYETAMRVLSYSGRRDPDITGSISSTLQYKNWRLGVLMDYAAGNKVRLFKVFNQGSTTNVGPAYIYPEYNLNRALINRWRKPGDEKNTNIPSIMSITSPDFYQYANHWSQGYNYQGVQFASNAWTMYDYSDVRVVSADYIRLASLSLTYELPQDILRRWGLERLAFTLTGNNLYTLCNSKLKGQTPTQSGFAEVQLSDTPYYTFSINIQL